MPTRTAVTAECGRRWRVHADYAPIKVPEGPPYERFVYLSDVLPTAWQAVEWADVSPGGSLVVLGLGPIGDMACRIARHRGIERVIGIDRVPERLTEGASGARRARSRRPRRRQGPHRRYRARSHRESRR